METKDDDSEAVGEKYLVDDARFHRKVGTTSLSFSSVPEPRGTRAAIDGFRLEIPAFLPPRGIRRC